MLRVLAAAVVFINHCVQLWYPQYFESIAVIAHRAVIVFFVLSGYVIALSTLAKRRDARSYVLARLSRLYSVTLPALALTGIGMAIGHVVAPDLYASISRGHDGLRFVLSGTFLQEAWFLSASPPTNAPLWSLGYEFWYYAFFGISLYARNGGARLAGFIIAAAIVGPKVLLLMPIWLLGVGIHVVGPRIRCSRAWGWIGFVVTTLALPWLVLHLPDIPWRHGIGRLGFSGAFLTDFVVGLGFALNIFFFSRAMQDRFTPDAAARAIRWPADHTFSLYLYHFPLLLLAGALIPFDRGVWWQTAGTIALVLATILVLSTVTEAKRKSWHNALAALYDKLFGRRTTV